MRVIRMDITKKSPRRFEGRIVEDGVGGGRFVGMGFALEMPEAKKRDPLGNTVFTFTEKGAPLAGIAARTAPVLFEKPILDAATALEEVMRHTRARMATLNIPFFEPGDDPQVRNLPMPLIREMNSLPP